MGRLEYTEAEYRDFIKNLRDKPDAIKWHIPFLNKILEMPPLEDRGLSELDIRGSYQDMYSRVWTEFNLAIKEQKEKPND